MEFLINTGEYIHQINNCLIIGIRDSKEPLSGFAQALDQASGGRLSATLQKGDLPAEAGSTLVLYDLPGIAIERIVFVSFGKATEYNRINYRKAIAGAITLLQKTQAGTAIWMLPDLLPAELNTYNAVRDVVLTASEKTYRYQYTKSRENNNLFKPLSCLTILVSTTQREAAELAIQHGTAIAQGVNLTKELGNLPANICTPSYLAEQAILLGTQFDKLTVTVLEETELQDLKMGALLSVARGSRQPPKLIILNYCNTSIETKPIVLIGKGLTFDAGGISLKPATDMDEMKFDMSGGACVLGAIHVACALQLPLNLIGIIPACENLPDGAANKPGDVVTSMSGQTIEIANTDAEGRLILCDALTYSERFNPALVIDLATLTGACVIALGKHPAGLFTNDDELAAMILQAGTEISDRAWRLPLWEEYQQQLDSNFADFSNVGGRDGGAITAACFLARFTKKLRWAHLDIAGIAWITGKEKGSTGRPVPLLAQFLLNQSNLNN